MRLLPILGLLLVLAGCQPRSRPVAATTAAATPSTVAAPDPARRLSDAARRALAAVTTTRYAHRTVIDVRTGTFVTDCSGFLTWLLRTELPGHLAAIPLIRGRSHPLASDYQQAFAAGAAGWQRIDRVPDIRPGDVLAWRHLRPKPGGSTGHVMIVDSPATPVGDDGFAVDVIDATSAPHDADTRVGTDGLGRGTIQVRVDAAGAAIAVRGNRRSPYRTHAITVARPVAP